MLKEILCLSDLGFILILTLVLIFLLILILDPREEKRCQKKSGKCCLWCLSDLCWILQIAQQANSPGSASLENLRKKLTQKIETQKVQEYLNQENISTRFWLRTRLDLQVA